MNRKEFLKFLENYCKLNYSDEGVDSVTVRSMLGKTIYRIQISKQLKCIDVLDELTKDIIKNVARSVNYSEKLYLILENMNNVPYCKNNDDNNHYTIFKSIVEGYRDFCSRKCSNGYSKNIVKRQISKGIRNINNVYSNKEFRSMLLKDLKRNGVAFKKIWNIPRSLLGKLQYLKNDKGENYLSILDSINKIGRTSGEKLYMVMNDIESIPKCKTCKTSDVDFYSIGFGYRTYCSLRCQTDSKEVRFKQQLANFRNLLTSLSESSRLKYLSTPLFDINNYKGVARKYLYKWKCNLCNNVFEDHLYSGHIPHCPKCFPKPKYCSSIPQEEITSFCKEYCNDVIVGDRKILNGLEIDILMPNKNLGIEYDSFWYHGTLFNEKHKEKSPRELKIYHANKTNIARQKEIDLIHVFEDEWQYDRDIVKSILKYKMGIANFKIGARECNILEIDNNIGSGFFWDNHLQHDCIGEKLYIGLEYNNILMSVMGLGKSRFNKKYEWELFRFCNKLNFIVNGSLSKLFKYFINNYNPTSVVTYANNRYGTGKSYKKCGFKFVKITEPGYWYTKKSKKYNRLNFTKKRLNKKYDNYNPKFSEWLNMRMRGYDKVWDCGNYVYEWFKK